jgi:hypothetical protein
MEKKMKETKTIKLNFWLTEKEKEVIKEKTEKYHFVSMSEYLRFVALNSVIKVENV